MGACGGAVLARPAGSADPGADLSALIYVGSTRIFDPEGRTFVTDRYAFSVEGEDEVPVWVANVGGGEAFDSKSEMGCAPFTHESQHHNVLVHADVDTVEVRFLQRGRPTIPEPRDWVDASDAAE